ncbi:MAG: hypothetical protein IJR32_04630 [Paludibacteraceae bacterium]|nr:hypothetical protein [Paludibacteraceae bacterium]
MMNKSISILLTLFALAINTFADDFSIASNLDTIRMVDLGLPSGTRWADRNIGADCPADTGNYYAWGELTSKNNYTWSTYLCPVNSDCGTNNDPIYAAQGNNLDISGSAFDAATVLWGSDYELPDSTQCAELLNSDYTTWDWTSQTDKNGHEMNGYLVTSKINSNTIFLPAAGYFSNATLSNVSATCYYWSATQRFDNARAARNLYINATSHVDNARARYYGHVIRPVTTASSTAVTEVSTSQKPSKPLKTLRNGYLSISSPDGTSFSLSGAKNK